MRAREGRVERRGKRRLDLAARATLFSMLLISCMAAACGFVALQVQQELSVRQGRDTAAQITTLLRRYIAGNLATGNYAAIQQAADRVGEWPHVTRSAVFDLNGRVVAAEGGNVHAHELATARRALQTRSVETYAGPDVIVAVTPSFHEGVLVGAHLVAMSRQSLSAVYLKLVLPIFLTLAAFLAIAAPITYIFVRKQTEPLRALTAFAGELNAARLGRQIAIKTGDEFETLGNAFNLMIRRIEGSMKRIQQLAFVDPVTQLPNHERFSRELNDHIGRSVAEGTLSAVVVFEFERMRRLIETLDQDSIQELMNIVAGRLVQAVRTVDRVVRIQSSQARPSVVACLRNHDFAVLAPSVTDPSEAARFAQMLNAAMNQTFEWRAHKMSLGASCGVAVAPRDGGDSDTVMRHAMMARTAARGGAGGLKLFTKALDREAVNRVTFEREMRAAIERNEFRAFFQPKINFETGRIEAAEALARWVRPDRTIVSPAKFIPAAEENGLIGQVSDAILREACWKAAGWARDGLPVQVAVNVSALQFRDEKFPEHVLRVLEHAGLPPYFLELEVTETVAMEDPERTARLIEPLRQKGVRFAIDDFGCGHSSLAALTRLPFDVIKIDQQFVRGLERGEKQAPAIVETILAMARTLDLAVVAEGVERREEAEFLQQRGCRYGQGFLYGAAVPPQQFAQMLKAQRDTHAGGEAAA